MLKRNLLALLGSIFLLIVISGCQKPESSDTGTNVIPDVKTAQNQEIDKPMPKNTPSGNNNTNSALVEVNSAGGGVLTAEPLVYEFGLIEPGVQQKGKFVLKNIGKETLEIIPPPRSGCGCTVVKLENYKLAPDETVELDFVYNPGNAPGKVSKNVWVDVKAPSKPKTLTLTFTAEIRKFIDIDPERITFNIRKDADNSGIIKLSSATDEAFKVTGFTCRDEVVKVEFDPSVSATQHELKYTVDMNKLRTLNSGIITITTSHPKARSVNIYYNSVLPVVAHPPTRRFAALQPGVPSSANVKVVSNFAEDFELGEITSQKGFVKVVSTKKTSDGYQIDIEMTVDPEEAKNVATRYVSDTLLITIKEYPNDTIRVYCYGQVVQPQQ